MTTDELIALYRKKAAQKPGFDQLPLDEQRYEVTLLLAKKVMSLARELHKLNPKGLYLRKDL
jgi:hypothetical protein